MTYVRLVQPTTCERCGRDLPRRAEAWREADGMSATCLHCLAAVQPAPVSTTPVPPHGPSAAPVPSPPPLPRRPTAARTPTPPPAAPAVPPAAPVVAPAEVVDLTTEPDEAPPATEVVDLTSSPQEAPPLADDGLVLPDPGGPSALVGDRGDRALTAADLAPDDDSGVHPVVAAALPRRPRRARRPRWST